MISNRRRRCRREQSEEAPTKTKRQLVENLLVILLASQQIILLAECQASDGDEQFQAYHQDIGRISGSASQAAVAAPTQTVLREPPAAAAAASHGPGEQPARARNPQPRKPNRITLAVRTHAPLQVSAAGPSEPVASLPAFSAAPAAQLGPQQSPFTPLAAPSFQPSFQSVAPAEPLAAPQVRNSALAGSVSARHAALMAQVAAERHQQVESQAQPLQVSPPAPLSGGEQSPSQAAVSAQVQPPPLLFQHQQQAASPALTFANRPEEPLVAPSFEQVLSSGCPQRGVFSWENKEHCDRYYMCTNGTFTEEACPNGLGYSQMGAVYQHCAYNWNVDCGTKKSAAPLASPGCPWQFGIFPVSGAGAPGRCSIDYFVCEWGVPETRRCSPEGLFYDDRIKGCQWADQLGCKSEALLNFKCPPEDEDNPYWPYPRYYHTKQDVIVCVNEQPRLVHCTEEQAVEPSSLACIDIRPKKPKRKP